MTRIGPEAATPEMAAQHLCVALEAVAQRSIADGWSKRRFMLAIANVAGDIYDLEQKQKTRRG